MNEGRYKHVDIKDPGDTFPFGYFCICRCKGIFIAKFSPDATLDQVDPLVSATAAKRSRGDVFRRESVLSDDRVCDRLSKFFKV